MYNFIRRILFFFDPEISHHIVFGILKLFNSIGLLNFFKSPKKNSKQVFGLNFNNSIGVAAGLDKMVNTLKF